LKRKNKQFKFTKREIQNKPEKRENQTNDMEQKESYRPGYQYLRIQLVDVQKKVKIQNKKMLGIRLYVPHKVQLPSPQRVPTHNEGH